MTRSLQFQDSKIKYVGALALLVLGIFSFLFYLERTIILDASYQTFAIIFHDNLAIQYSRFGAAITKWLPYLAYKLNASLDLVLRLYSISFIIYAAVFYFILVRLKNERMAMVLVLFFTLLVSHTFFWIQSEQLQVLALIILFFGLIATWEKIKWYHFGILLPLTIVWVYTHPLGFIAFSFLWLFFLVHFKWYKNIPYYLVMILAIGVLYYKHFLYPSNQYDSESFGLIKNMVDHFHEFFTLNSNVNFLGFIQTDYYFFPVFLLWIVGFYIYKKSFIKLLLVVSFTTAYLILINGSFWWGGEQFYLESYYHTYTIFLATPFVFDVLPAQRWAKKYGAYLFLVILTIRLIHIGLQRQEYKDRLDWNIALLEKTKQYGSTKFLVNQKDVPIDTLLMTWGTPFETLFLSARQSPDSTRTIYIFQEKDINLEEALKKNKTFLTPFGPIDFNSMPKEYFNFQDTSAYKLLKKEDLH